MKTRSIITVMLLSLSGLSAYAQTQPVVDVYETATCPCCKDWDSHMRQSGFNVRTHFVDDPSKIREQMKMPHRYGSCHTAKIDGYIIEGHVPASDIKRLLKDRPNAIGLAVPGMVQGSPGMEGPKPMPYDTLLIQKDGTSTKYVSH